VAEKTPLLPLDRKYFERDTQAAACRLEMMTEGEAAQVLAALPANLAVQALQHLQVSYTAALLENANAALFKEIATALEPQHAATIFMHLPEDASERRYP
jgi:Mg/Co/Ni transporter MgtE